MFFFLFCFLETERIITRISIIMDQYELLDKLTTDTTTGDNGALYRAKERATNTIVVVRILPLSKTAGTDEHWMKAEGVAGLVPLRKRLYVGTDQVWLVHPYYPRGSFYDYMCQQKGKRVSEAMIQGVLRSVLTTLIALHERGLWHGHLKASNVILGDHDEEEATPPILLGDFAAPISSASSQYLYWRPPETATDMASSCAGDVWGVGTLSIEMATGAPPYAGFPPNRALALIRDHSSPVLVGNFSTKLKNFVAQCVTKDIAKRPSSKVLLNESYF